MGRATVVLVFLPLAGCGLAVGKDYDGNDFVIKEDPDVRLHLMSQVIRAPISSIPAQPNFLTLAMTCPADFDVEFGDEVRGIARESGLNHLHASEIGADAVDSIAPRISELINRSQVRFHPVLVAKPDSALFQFFYALFDPGENPAASTSAYLFRELRFALVLHLASIVELEDVQVFWEVITSVRSPETESKIVQSIDKVLQRATNLTDARVSTIDCGDFVLGSRQHRSVFVLVSKEKRPLQIFA